MLISQRNGPLSLHVKISVSQYLRKRRGLRTGAFIWQPCVVVAFQKSRGRDLRTELGVILKGLQRHEAVDKLRGRIRSLALCQSGAKGLNFSKRTGSAKIVSDDLDKPFCRPCSRSGLNSGITLVTWP